MGGAVALSRLQGGRGAGARQRARGDVARGRGDAAAQEEDEEVEVMRNLLDYGEGILTDGN